VGLTRRLAEKPDINEFVTEVLREPSMISELIDIITTDKTSIKFFCTKVIRLTSEQHPDIVFPHFDAIAKLIESNNSFIKWDAIATISNLVCVDSMGKYDLIHKEYFDFIKDPRMITAATVVGNAWKIVMHKPHFESDITKRLLSVPDILYYSKGNPSPECNNVMCGHVIDCFDKYYSASKSKDEICNFVRQQLGNTRKQVAKKAESFLKKHHLDER
jgi:hypothetical protein